MLAYKPRAQGRATLVARLPRLLTLFSSPFAPTNLRPTPSFRAPTPRVLAQASLPGWPAHPSHTPQAPARSWGPRSYRAQTVPVVRMSLHPFPMAPHAQEGAPVLSIASAAGASSTRASPFGRGAGATPAPAPATSTTTSLGGVTLSVVSDLHLEARPLELDEVIDPELKADGGCAGFCWGPGTRQRGGHVRAWPAGFPAHAVTRPTAPSTAPPPAPHRYSQHFYCLFRASLSL